MPLMPLGGSAPGPWKPVLSWDQGALPYDPTGVTAPGTGAAADGTLTWVMAGDTVRVDGYNEASAGWTRRVVDLYPGFDSTRDLIDVCMVDPTIPLLTGSEKYGLMLSLLDAPRGTAGAGTAVGLYPQSSSAMQEASFAASSSNASGNFTGVCTRALVNFQGRPDGARIGVRWWQLVGGVWLDGSGVGTTPQISADASTWRIGVGHVHVSTTSATPTMSCKVYTRRTRTAGLSGLP